MNSFALRNHLSLTFIENRLPIAALLLILFLGILGFLLAPPEYALIALIVPLALLVGIFLLMHPEIVLVLIVINFPLENADIWDVLFPFPGSLSLPKLLGMLLLAAFFFHVIFRRQQFRFLDDTQDYVVLFFCAAMLFSGITSTQLSAVISEIDQVFRLVAFYIAVKNLVKGPRIMYILMLGLFISSVYASYYGITVHNTVLGEWGNRVRAAGIGENPNNFALESVMAFSMGIFLFLAAKRLTMKLLLAIGIFIVVLGILLSASRGGALSFLTVVSVLILRHPKRIQLAAAALTILVVTLPFWPSDITSRYFPSLTRTDFSNAYQKSAENSLERRMGYYEFGVQLISEHPINGTGYRTFSQLFSRSRFARFDNPLIAFDTYRVAHNVYLETVVGTGLLGLFALIGMIYTAWRGSNQAANMLQPGTIEWATARGVELAIIGFAVSSFFISSEQFKQFWYLMGMSSALLYYARSLQRSKQLSPSEDKLAMQKPLMS